MPLGLPYCIKCEGNCIKPYKDIIERFFRFRFDAEQFVRNCHRRKHGYKCEAETTREEYIDE